jgi:alpha-D-ribose 1-methylphosphonate 5-triphosphate diphosphatase PhnM
LATKSNSKPKKAREAAALLSLKKDYGEFKAMIKAIEEYEAKQNLEAELVYTMEKLVTETNVYNCRGDYFFERKIDIISWKKWLLGKINYENLSLNIKPIVDEAIAEIEENHKNIFYAG